MPGICIGSNFGKRTAGLSNFVEYSQNESGTPHGIPNDLYLMPSEFGKLWNFKLL